jgi:probable F420-dependent oxidoreductase
VGHAAIDSKYPYSEGGDPSFVAQTDFPEPYAAISAMAAVTTKIRFNTAIYIAPLRHPVALAKSVATASALSGGRVALGVGVGWLKEEFDALGEDFHTRGRRLDEMIEVMRKLWTGEYVEHHGRFFDFDELKMLPAPIGRVPIYSGGHSVRALKRAGALCDGWLGTGNSAAELPGIMAKTRQYREEAGRGSEPFENNVAVLEPPDPGLYRDLEERGATAFVNFPPGYGSGGLSFDEKRAALEKYGNEIIAKY